MLDLTIDGRRVDMRTVEARRYRTLANDLQIQLGRSPSASERALLSNTATLAMLCERDTAKLLDGGEIDQENYRRNVAMLGQQLTKLGMAMKSRDVKKSDLVGQDAFGAAVIEANK